LQEKAGNLIFFGINWQIAIGYCRIDASFSDMLMWDAQKRKSFRQ